MRKKYVSLKAGQHEVRRNAVTKFRRVVIMSKIKSNKVKNIAVEFTK